MEKLFAAGVFGRLVYSEGEYCHPHSLGAPSLGSYKNWRENGCPMWYPTHATAYYVGVTHKNGLQLQKHAPPPGVQPGEHGGSHGYLGDDFIDSILRGRKPAVDVIDALNMTVPGYYAHLSSMKDGETMKIPQYSL